MCIRQSFSHRRHGRFRYMVFSGKTAESGSGARNPTGTMRSPSTRMSAEQSPRHAGCFMMRNAIRPEKCVSCCSRRVRTSAPSHVAAGSSGRRRGVSGRWRKRRRNIPKSAAFPEPYSGNTTFTLQNVRKAWRKPTVSMSPAPAGTKTKVCRTTGLRRRFLKQPMPQDLTESRHAAPAGTTTVTMPVIPPDCPSIRNAEPNRISRMRWMPRIASRRVTRCRFTTITLMRTRGTNTMRRRCSKSSAAFLTRQVSGRAGRLTSCVPKAA